jgi:hypothetical protein
MKRASGPKPQIVGLALMLNALDVEHLDTQARITIPQTR